MEPVIEFRRSAIARRHRAEGMQSTTGQVPSNERDPFAEQHQDGKIRNSDRDHEMARQDGLMLEEIFPGLGADHCRWL